MKKFNVDSLVFLLVGIGGWVFLFWLYSTPAFGH